MSVCHHGLQASQRLCPRCPRWASRTATPWQPPTARSPPTTTTTSPSSPRTRWAACPRATPSSRTRGSWRPGPCGTWSTWCRPCRPATLERPRSTRTTATRVGDPAVLSGRDNSDRCVLMRVEHLINQNIMTIAIWLQFSDKGEKCKCTFIINYYKLLLIDY